jgi:hypothetical protein
LVSHLYESFLGRIGTAQEVAVWSKSALTCAELMNSFGTSNEFQIRSTTLSATAFVTTLYEGFYNRNPDTDFWIQAVQAGTISRSSLVNEFFISAETAQKCSQVWKVE